ncbi:MAG: 50S ribosomal protein L20 [Bdellovibrionales bacterium CG12_big_fil_rev_8_21_14_0_65_38_15]|nr:MAG: 50S ribosomal protein L20 [Bdellovibrionales bacterium CG22_combo_CG10-13_8_21_14_all_38_13]PIQ55656.1 MAG: 50S ribosomal protein L20 [Bdellovibrionales bacterium CG12_big_fil_rev_8_21_14_0_65_38_15]PIR30666.1 MAG: 50S ribosomal protein L20 [Bdellovibrionales bacterium CG11_big_fil_rev_8_21_14_0_20_38_13]
MARVRRGFKARRRRNKVLKLAKGFHFDRRTKYRHTAETVKRALHYAYISRRLLKRDMRQLWIARINAATRELGISYSQFIGKLRAKGLDLNRKMLSEIAARDAVGFKAIVEAVTK